MNPEKSPPGFSVLEAGAGPWRVLLLILLPLLAYLPAWLGGFVWDDLSLILNNPLIQRADGLAQFWNLRQRETPDFFPLVSSLFWVEYRCWGMDAAGYHIVNLLLHVANGILLWRLLTRLAIPGAWLGALLFALHPVNVPSVAWISEGKNTLSFLFYLLAFLAWLGFDDAAEPEQRRTSWLAMIFCGTLAMLAKSTTVVLPPALLLLQLWRRGRLTRRDLLAMAPLWIIALGLGLLTLDYQHHGRGGLAAVAGVPQILLQAGIAVSGKALAFYVGKALLPVQLCPIYPKWDLSQGVQWTDFAIVAAILAATAGLFWQRQRPVCRNLLFALGYFAVSLFPVLGFFPTSFSAFSYVSDHWVYLSLPVLTTLLAAGVASLACRLSRPRGAAVAILAWAGILFYGWQTTAYAAVYQNSEKYWDFILEKNPTAWIAWNNRGALFHDNKEYGESIRCFRVSTRLNPDLAVTWDHLSGAYGAANDIPRAIEAMQTAVVLQPANPVLQLRLARLLHTAGRSADAIHICRDILQAHPDRPEPLIKLAWFWATARDASQRSPDQAEALARQALEMTHGEVLDAWEALAAAQAARGEFPRAVETLETAWRRFATTPDGVSQLVLKRADLQTRLRLYRQSIAEAPEPPP